MVLLAGHGLFGRVPWLGKPGSGYLGAALGLQVYVARACLPEAVTVAVSNCLAGQAFDIEAGATQPFDVEFHHALGNELDHCLSSVSSLQRDVTQTNPGR
nr:hypothetical protein [Pseudomonas fulva]